MASESCIANDIHEVMCKSSRLTFHQLSYQTHPYPPSVKEELLRMIDSEGGGGKSGDTSVLRELCIYNALLGRIFADAAKAVVAQAGMNMYEVALIGSHG